ncbi:MAG: hypothetical protein LBF04_04850 [Prevotellaceae bacterium]|nr:hypothetical protein [Prevotellaceae bacterium]
MSFSDTYVEKRVRKNVFFKHINILIDWSAPEKEIDKKRGKSVDGCPAYKGILLFMPNFYQNIICINLLSIKYLYFSGCFDTVLV